MITSTSTSVIRNLARVFSGRRDKERRDKDPRDCVLSQIPKGGVCAEIGVFKGDFSALILECEPRKLHLIDPWKFEHDPDYAGSWYGGRLGKNQEKMDSIHQSVAGRFRAEIESGVVEVHRSSSAECAAQFADEYFDWIYIDGNHKYDFVKLDLEAFLPKVKRHGLVAGDDYDSPGWWQDGVTKAVDEAIVSGRFEKVLLQDHQFLLKKLWSL